jgi:tetratricopeptide (TPR) repeat protein
LIFSGALLNQSVLIGLFVLIIIVVFLLSKKSTTSARAHKMGRKSFKQRHADSRKLSRHEKKLLTKAKQFIVQKRFLQAARLLESIRMERDAITLLEKSGHIHEAAHMLLRMRRPNRAGVVYARNNYFTNAAECFLKAGMPLEAAQCARSSGDHKLAAAAFEKVGEFGEAAQSYVSIGAYINAARCYYKADQIDSAMASYKKKFQNTEDFNFKTLTSEDLSYVTRWLSAGHFDESIAEAAKRTDLLPKIIHSLSSSGHMNSISNLVPFCDIQDLNVIMSKVNYEDISAKTLALGLKEAGDHERSGMIFEQLGMFQDAAEAFEIAQDFERASYLWGRAGNNERSELAKQKKSENPGAKAKSNAIEGNFALGTAGAMALSDDNLAINNSADASSPVPPPAPAADPSPSVSQSFSLSSSEAAEAQPVNTPPPPSFDLNQVPEVPSPSNTNDSVSASFSLDVKPETSDQDQSNNAPKSFFQSGLWIDLTGVECQKIWDRGEVIDIGKGDIVVSDKENSPGLYVLLSGTVSAQSSHSQSTLSAGDYFGDLASFAEISNSCSYSTLETSKLWLIKTNELEDLMEEDGVIARKVYKTFTTDLLKRLSQEQITQILSKVS